ncbi:MAG: OmpH family outer membrane protein [Bacteroidaceae bacterium]|nr:OmpH family outer membrane protein [Bacteroidaceae bacterium]
MKTVKLLFSVIMVLLPVSLWAQSGHFGYMDFNGTLKLMPEYKVAQENLQKIQSDYKEEIDRSKREFERQYVEFMLVQNQLAPSIVAKRQKELQVLMDTYSEFRDSAQSELENRREELLVPIKEKLIKAVNNAGKSMNLDYVIDTGTKTYLYIDPERGVDISNRVYRLLGLKETVSEGGDSSGSNLMPLK